MSSPRVSAEAAQQEARRALASVRFQDQPGVAEAVAAGWPGPPLLVRRLDAEDQAYYLVPWCEQQGIRLIVQVDAGLGRMASLALQSQPLQSLVLPPSEASQSVASQLGLAALGEPELVWMPCRQSSSPFLPLYRVGVPGGDVFVAMDGVVHSRLAPMLRGG